MPTFRGGGSNPYGTAAVSGWGGGGGGGGNGGGMQNSWSTGIPQGPPPGMGQQGGSGGGGHWSGGGGGGGRSRGGMGGGHARNSRVFGGVQFQQGGHGAGGGGGYMQQSRMRKPNGYDEVSRQFKRRTEDSFWVWAFKLKFHATLRGERRKFDYPPRPPPRVIFFF